MAVIDASFASSILKEGEKILFGTGLVDNLGDVSCTYKILKGLIERFGFQKEQFIWAIKEPKLASNFNTFNITVIDSKEIPTLKATENIALCVFAPADVALLPYLAMDRPTLFIQEYGHNSGIYPDYSFSMNASLGLDTETLHHELDNIEESLEIGLVLDQELIKWAESEAAHDPIKKLGPLLKLPKALKEEVFNLKDESDLEKFSQNSRLYYGYAHDQSDLMKFIQAITELNDDNDKELFFALPIEANIFLHLEQFMKDLGVKDYLIHQYNKDTQTVKTSSLQTSLSSGKKVHLILGKQRFKDVIEMQNRFEKKQREVLDYPTQETEGLEEKAIYCLGWLTAPLLEQEEVLALTILDSVLMDTDASLLKKALLDSGFCVTADSYMDSEMSELPYLLLCKGCRKEKMAELEKCIYDTLKSICEKKIPFRLIESALHQIEFSRTEITCDQSPFGLTLFMRAALAKQNGCSPEDALTMHAHFENLLHKAKHEPAYFTNLIKKYFIENTHCVQLTLVPNPELTSKEIHEEKKKLAAIKEKLTEKQIAKILQQTKNLEHYYETTKHQSIDCLPKIHLSDIPKACKDFPIIQETKSNMELFFHPCFTNQIVYADLFFDLPEMNYEELFYIKLLSLLLPELGAGDRKYGQQLEWIHAHTGGIGAACSLIVNINTPKKVTPTLQLRGKALKRKSPQLFSTLNDICLSLRLDETKRIEQLIDQIATSMQNQLSRSALKYAINLALQDTSPASFINNLWNGVDFYQKMQHLNQNFSTEKERLLEGLKSAKQKLFSSPFHMVMSCDEEQFNELSRHFFYHMNEQLPKVVHHPWKESRHHETQILTQARPISSPVAFTAQAFATSVDYLHPLAPAIQAASYLLENKILHHRIRELGGAYGCGAAYNAIWGHFYFYSYRDQHIARTVKTFRESLFELSSQNFTEADLEEAKLGVIQQMDHPVSPGNRALTSYHLWRSGKTIELRNHFRSRLLAVTSQDILDCIDKLITEYDAASTVSFAGKELIEKEQALFEPDKTLAVVSI